MANSHRVNLDTRDLRLALQWCSDVQGGEMITAPDYTRTSLVLRVSRVEIEAIKDSVNAYYRGMGSAFRVRAFVAPSTLEPYYRKKP